MILNVILFHRFFSWYHNNAFSDDSVNWECGPWGKVNKKIKEILPWLIRIVSHWHVITELYTPLGSCPNIWISTIYLLRKYCFPEKSLLLNLSLRLFKFSSLAFVKKNVLGLVRNVFNQNPIPDLVIVSFVNFLLRILLMKRNLPNRKWKQKMIAIFIAYFLFFSQLFYFNLFFLLSLSFAFVCWKSQKEKSQESK